MGRIYPEVTYSILLAFILQTSTQAQICSVPPSASITENNTIGAFVVNITKSEDMTVTVVRPDTFKIFNGNQLIAQTVLDREIATEHRVEIQCQPKDRPPFGIQTIVIVDDVNDNPPVFQNSPYDLHVNELLPVGTTVGSFPAQDRDANTKLYYTLSSSAWFALPESTRPDIVVKKVVDYDTTKSEELILSARDTEKPSPPDEPSFTATTSIFVTIKDVDNRPPWFQPCTVHSIEGGTKVCLGSGYRGTVNLTEMEDGPLTLHPGPIYAIDGDSGINDVMVYRFINGNGDGMFQINPDSGNITMVKPADTEGDIKLTVMATQSKNPSQLATTPVTITVTAKTNHPLRFEKTKYEAVVTGVGSMALDTSKEDEPLRILAKDNDYPEGLNPSVTYKVLGSSDFSIIQGYLFMTKNRPSELLTLQVEAADPSNGQSDTADLTVEVIAEVTSTTSNPTTTEITSGPSTTETVNTEVTSTTSNPTATEITSGPSTTETVNTEVTSTTSTPTTTEITSGPSTTETVNTDGGKSGDYRLQDMAALGASLAVLLVICMAVIGFLIHLIQGRKADWMKISEASIFRSTLGRGPGGLKEGVQYTNEGFQNDEDTGSVGSGGPETTDVKFSSESGTKTNNIPLEETIMKSTAPLHTLLSDNTSLAGSDKADSEKEVKPILTKERRVEEGYKSVWFKEDIDPNAGDEVVIIPENRDQDGDDEDEDEEEEEEEGSLNDRDEDDNSPRATPNVFFADADLDSGLGVKIQDPTEDSDDDRDFTADL